MLLEGCYDLHPMKWKPAAFFIFALCSVLASGQQPEIKDALLNHLVVPRNYYVGADLRFDESGRLLTPASEGFGQLDARVFVKAVEMKDQHLHIRGERTFAQYDSKANIFRAGLTGEKVDIDIELPVGNGGLGEVLNKVFLTASELQNRCSAEEQTRFEEVLSQLSSHQRLTPPSGPQAKDLANLNRTCFPTGEEVYRAGVGVKPPKALHTPDPVYSESARKQREQGSVLLLIIVDQKGNTSTPYVIRPLNSDLDKAALHAVQKWQFDPALFQGTPVPVMINVEMSFRLF